MKPSHLTLLPDAAQYAYNLARVPYSRFRVRDEVRYVRSLWRPTVSWVPHPHVVSFSWDTWDSFDLADGRYVWLLLHETHHCFQAWRAECKTGLDWWTWYWPRRGLYAPANTGLEGESIVWADKWTPECARYARTRLATK